MSTMPDDPTRRPPSYPPAENGYWLEELRDQVRSLKTAVLLLGILTVVTLGIAAWALLAKQDTSGSTANRGVSPGRVTRLESRVSDLEARVRSAPTKSDLADLKAEQKALSTRVGALEKASRDAASQQSVDQIQQDVQDLQKRVDAIEQQQANPAPTP
jgi:polyhydroxyalkanoate synthesis regulator phasin